MQEHLAIFPQTLPQPECGMLIWWLAGRGFQLPLGATWHVQAHITGLGSQVPVRIYTHPTSIPRPESILWAGSMPQETVSSSF